MDMVIAVGGLINVGKSSTINAIAGCELLPMRNSPMTLLSTLIRHKPGQSDPVLEIGDPKPINEMLGQLKNKVGELNQEERDKIPNNEFNDKCEGAKEISRTLTYINDLFPIASQHGVAIPYENYCEIDNMPVISVEYSFLRNHDNAGVRGQLVLMDTPGYNKNRQGNLGKKVTEAVGKQLDHASGIIGLMDFTQSGTPHEDEFCNELNSIAGKGHRNISAWANKWDLKNRTSEEEDEFKNRLAGRLAGVLKSDDIFFISANNACLADNARRELEKDNWPNWDPNVEGWLKDFYKEAFGQGWKRSIPRRLKNITIKEVAQEGLETLLEKGFQQPIKHVYSKATILTLQSASNKLNENIPTVMELVTDFLTFLNDEIKKLKIENDLLKNMAEFDKTAKNIESICEKTKTAFLEKGKENYNKSVELATKVFDITCAASLVVAVLSDFLTIQKKGLGQFPFGQLSSFLAWNFISGDITTKTLFEFIFQNTKIDLNNSIPFDSHENATNFLKPIEKELSSQIEKYNSIYNSMKELETKKIINFNIGTLSIEEIINFSDLIKENLLPQEGVVGLICDKLKIKELGKVKLFLVDQPELEKLVESIKTHIQKTHTDFEKYIRHKDAEVHNKNNDGISLSDDKDLQQLLKRNEADKTKIEKLKEDLESIKEKLKQNDVEALDKAINKLMPQQLERNPSNEKQPPESSPNNHINNSNSPTREAVELVGQQEQKTAAIFQKYHREFVPTVRDGDCFYDGMSKVRSDSSIMELRERSCLEGQRCLAGRGKLHFDAALTSVFRGQIEQLRRSGIYAEQIDLRLMAATENCRIIVCDLDEKVLSVVGPEGELEEYPKKTLSEVMSQDPETELFVLDTQGQHYMAGRKRFNGNQQPGRNSSNEYQPLEPSPSVVAPPPPPLLSSTTTPKPSRAAKGKVAPRQTQRQAVRSSQVNAASDTVKTSRNQKPGRVTSNECQQPGLTRSTEFPPTIAELIAREMDQRRVVIDDSPDKSESPNDSDWDES